MGMFRGKAVLLTCFLGLCLYSLLFMTACSPSSAGQQTGNSENGSTNASSTAAQEQQGTNSDSNANSTSTEAVPEQINIAMRNSTTRGGFTLMAGEKLIDEGFDYAHNYIVDIGNISYPIPLGDEGFPSSKSLILIPENNDTLKAEAKSSKRF